MLRTNCQAFGYNQSCMNTQLIPLHIVLWSLFGYLCGSIPFSFLVGKYLARQDIRQVGDGNPGGTNVWKAGGWYFGLLAIALDIFKGSLPVMLARQAGLATWGLIPICLAPMIGHATTPFLGFRGGKALGAAGGAWSVVIGLWVFAIFSIFSLSSLIFIKDHAWAALVGVFSLLLWAVLVANSTWMIVLAICTILLMIWTHRLELAHLPQHRSWIDNLGRKNRND